MYLLYRIVYPSAHPIVATLLLDKISLDYTETLMAAAGEQAEAAKEETMKKYYGIIY